MSQRLGMADGRCFTVASASTLFNDYVMAENNIMPQDNYSYRKLLQQQGPKILGMTDRKGPCITCNTPMFNLKNTY